MGENGDLIRQSYDAFARGDVHAVLDTLTDDVQWDVPGSLPQGGSFSGKDGVGEFFQNLGQTYDGISLEVEDLVDGGDNVVGVGTATGKLRDAGTSVEYGFAHVFTVSGGKVTRFREYADPRQGL